MIAYLFVALNVPVVDFVIALFLPIVSFSYENDSIAQERAHIDDRPSYPFYHHGSRSSRGHLHETGFTFLIPFFFGSIIAVYTFYNFNLVIQKMMLLKEEAEAAKDEAIGRGREASVSCSAILLLLSACL